MFSRRRHRHVETGDKGSSSCPLIFCPIGLSKSDSVCLATASRNFTVGIVCSIAMFQIPDSLKHSAPFMWAAEKRRYRAFCAGPRQSSTAYALSIYIPRRRGGTSQNVAATASANST